MLYIPTMIGTRAMQGTIQWTLANLQERKEDADGQFPFRSLQGPTRSKKIEKRHDSLSPREPPKSNGKQRATDESRVKTSLWSRDASVLGGRSVVQIVLVEIRGESEDGTDYELHVEKKTRGSASEEGQLKREERHTGT